MTIFSHTSQEIELIKLGDTRQENGAGKEKKGKMSHVRVEISTWGDLILPPPIPARSYRKTGWAGGGGFCCQGNHN